MYFELFVCICNWEKGIKFGLCLILDDSDYYVNFKNKNIFFCWNSID